VVTKTEEQCYVCGDTVPQRRRARARVKQYPVSGLTNFVFLASLAFTAYCFFATHKLSLPTTIAISSGLLAIRLLAEKLAARNSN
jgi:hypothetical protein